MRTNRTRVVPTRTTYEGAKARGYLPPFVELERTIMSCMLWEDNFYMNGEQVGQKILSLVPKVKTQQLVDLLIKVRHEQGLRHAPLLAIVGMLKEKNHRRAVGDLIPKIAKRPDDLTELFSLYRAANGGKGCPIAKQLRVGIKRALSSYDTYQLAKYQMKGKEVPLQLLFHLFHPKPKPHMIDTFKDIRGGRLAPPETWNVELTRAGQTGKSQFDVWMELLVRNKVPAFALIRNLRNLKKAGVDPFVINTEIGRINSRYIQPFHYILAAGVMPEFEPALWRALCRNIKHKEKFQGRTIILVDVSGSMEEPLSSNSDAKRFDAAFGLAMILNELCVDPVVYSFSMALKRIPPRSGFALRDALMNSQQHSGTPLGLAVDSIFAPRSFHVRNTMINGRNYPVDFPGQNENCDRLIVITDEQSTDNPRRPKCEHAYMINVGVYTNSIAFHPWISINGWSPAVVDYIQQIEQHKTDWQLA